MAAIDYDIPGTDVALEWLQCFWELFPDDKPYGDFFDSEGVLVDEDGWDQQWCALVAHCNAEGI